MLLFLTKSLAQELPLESLIEKAQVAMEEKRWGDALELNTRAIEIHGGDNPMEIYGPQFGAIFYQKGICEMKLKRWNEAIRSFEICYRDFPNKNLNAVHPNRFQKMALLKWGEAAMGAEKWNLALSRFAKFTEERDKVRDLYPQGAFHVNMAICRYEMGEIKRGNESLEIAIRNRTLFPTPETGIIAGFQGLVRAAIAKREEQTLLDFMTKNRGPLLVPPYISHRYSEAFLKLAGDAIGAGMPHAAFAIYQFVPSTDVAIDDVKARLKSLGPAERIKDGTLSLVRSELEADLAKLETVKRGKQAPEMVKLTGIAYLHESAGNFHGAFAAYRLLELYFPYAEKREENLLNLIRVSARIGAGRDLREFGSRFLKDLPESPRALEVKQFLLDSFFESGNFIDCIAMAESIMAKTKEGTPEHERALHLLAAACFHTAQYKKAQPLLDRQIELYPTGKYALMAAYLQAINAIRAGEVSRGTTLLDQFLTRHPNPEANTFLATALYERAILYDAAKNETGAREKLDRLIAGFPGDPLMGKALLLRGRINRSTGNTIAAKKDFSKALQIADTFGNRDSAAEALAESIDLLAATSDSKQTGELFILAARFWKGLPANCPWQNRVAIAQTKFLITAGREEEALARLAERISQAAQQPTSPDFSSLVDAYTEAYLSTHGPEELAKHYVDFSGIPAENRLARGTLKMAAISELEKRAERTPDEAAKQAALTLVRTLFQRFKNDLNPTEMSSRDLLRLGDFLHLKTSTPLEAIPYYDEVIGRNNPMDRFPALLGRGDVRSRSEVPADLDSAVTDFTTVYQHSTDRAERDYALFRLINLLDKKGATAEAVQKAEFYLSNKRDFTDFIPQTEAFLTSRREKPKTSSPP